MKLIRQALLFWKQAVDTLPAAKEHKAYQEFVRDIALKSYVDIVEFIRAYQSTPFFRIEDFLEPLYQDLKGRIGVFNIWHGLQLWPQNLKSDSILPTFILQLWTTWPLRASKKSALK